MLQSTWKQEAASDRAKFLEVLALNLSLEDEPFLEAALDDRSQPVKRAAAKLLNKLPASRRGQRMAERVRSLVQIQRQGTGYTITVELPPTCDAAMQRDGIEVKAPGSKGDRAWWLEQLLIAAPLETWEKPDVDHIQALWAATEGHDWQSLIQSSWNLAILYQRQVTWAKALLTHHLTPGWHNGLFSLLGLLPPAEQVELVLQALHDPQRRVNHLLEVLLIATSIKNWPLELGQRTLDILIELLPNLGDARYGMVRQLLPHLARCLPPELLPAAAQLPQVAEQIPQSVRNYYLPQDLQAFLLTLEFRRDLHQAFSS